MSTPPRVENLVADAQPQASAAWEIRASSEVLLSGALSGRLRAGIILGVRVCRDAQLRDRVTRRLLLRLGRHL